MKIARFDEGRLGVVVDEQHIVDIGGIVGFDPAQWPPIAATSLIGRFSALEPAIRDALPRLPRIPLASVKLLTPVPWPNKVIAYPVKTSACHADPCARRREIMRAPCSCVISQHYLRAWLPVGGHVIAQRRPPCTTRAAHSPAVPRLRRTWRPGPGT